MRSRAEYAAALVLQLAGGGFALLLATRSWQTVHTPRERPLADDVLQLSGRTIDAAPTALALVALAGVVAVVATRGVLRRAVGVVLVVTGGLLIWRAASGLSAVSATRARDLVRSHHSGVGVDAASAPHVAVHAQWAVLTLACGVLVALAGALVAARGARWSALSAKYEAPRPALSARDLAAQRQRADASMWKALDAGDDPTAHT
jgi:uncharacterized membrane protein (TIGR02234 family)